MKKLFLLSPVLFCLLIPSSAFSQGFIQPAEGNAVVYFVRVTAFGGMMPFEFFHDRQLIGRITGLAYLRYELPAGESLLWGSSENKEFLQCNLEAEETYLVLVNVKMGAWTSRLELEPITEKHKEFQRVKEHVNDKPPMQITEESIAKSMEKLEERGFIDDVMKNYEKKWKNSPATKKITADMAIPEDML
ncbi:MAG: hypothetical protein JW894_14260 [Bacteroidales bacterium]|nr:hypothetical protein [Bacteroidales bacterium]